VSLEEWIAWLRTRIAAAQGRPPEAFVATLPHAGRPPAYGVRFGFRLDDLRKLLARAERARDAEMAAREMAS